MSITTEEIKEIAVRVSLGMSKNQILDYVIKSHVTADRQLKQVFLEIENRSHQYENVKAARCTAAEPTAAQCHAPDGPTTLVTVREQPD